MQGLGLRISITTRLWGSGFQEHDLVCELDLSSGLMSSTPHENYVGLSAAIAELSTLESKNIRTQCKRTYSVHGLGFSVT